MTIPLTINGVTIDYPETGDEGWGPDATDWASAVTVGMLQKAGGLFTLLAEVDFGATYGIKSAYYKTRASNIADAGAFRLARTDVVSWRNQGNSANLDLGVNSSNLLTFNGTVIQNTLSVTDTATIDLTLVADVLSADIKSDSITNSMVNSAAAIAYSKLNLTGSILNADVNASAAIALTKLAATTVSRALVSDGSGFITAATTTATEIGYVNGVTSAIQTQLNAKGNNPTTTTGDTLYASNTATPATLARLGIGAVNTAYVSTGTLPSWALLVNANIDAAAAIAYSKLNLTGSIVNADVNASAAIALTKLAATTVSRALVSDGSGFIVPATTTAVEIGYVNGVTSAIQTQLNAKQATGNYITALTGDVTASGPGSVAATLAATSNATLVTLSGLTTAASLATVGTITSGTWSATTIAVNKGGTGVTSVTTAPTATAFAGWDANSNLRANSFLAGYTTTATAAGTTTLTVASTYQQYFTGATTQTVVLPVTSTLILGQQYQIINNSNGVVTVQSSGANTIQAMAANTSATYTCILTSGTTAASWSVLYISATGAGTVTSVAMSVPAFLSISGSPVTTSGTLAVSYSGTALPVANGGTAVTSVTTSPTASSFAGWDANSNLSANSTLDGYATTATAAATTTLTVASKKQQYFTGTTTQTVVLPVTSTLVLGQQFKIVNSSTGSVTLQSSGANNIQVMLPGSTSIVTCILTSGTTAASWSNNYLTTSRTFPTVQTFTSGSGTYTTPANVTYIQVEMVGGGGGASGSGGAGGSNGTSGGNTTFSTLVAGLGVGGTFQALGGAGGTNTTTGGTTIINVAGGAGMGSIQDVINTTSAIGGGGGNSFFGGAGAATLAAQVGGAAAVNSGSGGGGGGGANASGSYSGSGGGAGGYLKSLIGSPAATYSYGVGAGGGGGSAGATGNTGGAGGSGYIAVTEFYN